MDDQLFQPSDFIIQMAITRSPGINAPDGMHHGRVITPSEIASDLTEAETGVLASEIHSNLPRKGDGLVSTLRQEIRDPQSVVAADRIQDFLDGGRASWCG